MESNPLQTPEMVRTIRDAIYEETKDLSREELKAYFAREAAALRREVAESQPERRPGPPGLPGRGEPFAEVTTASHCYRVVKRLPWIEGGSPASRFQWEGGRTVTYEPGDTINVDDWELAGIYHHLEAIDNAGRTALEEIRAKAEAPAQITFVADLSTAERSHLAWGLASSEAAHGEDLKAVLMRALRNGAVLPNDSEFRNWFVDVLEGKHASKRGKGRPPKKQQRPDFLLAIVERSIYETYRDWLAAFERDPELAWLRFEALRLREQHPDERVWRRAHDLGNEEDLRSYKLALKALGAQPCPPKLQGEQTPRDLALRATARQCQPGWKSATDKFLTASIVARVVTSERARRAKKSE